MRLKVQRLTAEVFAQYGQVLSLPSKEPTAIVDGGLTYWDDVLVLPDVGGPIGVGYCTVVKRPLTQTQLERHMRTPEFLQPVKGAMIVVVGPPLFLDIPNRLPPLEEFAAFRVEEGQAVALFAGVWHYAPFAVCDPIRLTVMFRAGTSKNDVVVVDLPDGEVFEIDL